MSASQALPYDEQTTNVHRDVKVILTVPHAYGRLACKVDNNVVIEGHLRPNPAIARIGIPNFRREQIWIYRGRYPRSSKSRGDLRYILSFEKRSATCVSANAEYPSRTLHRLEPQDTAMFVQPAYNTVFDGQRQLYLPGIQAFGSGGRGRKGEHTVIDGGQTAEFLFKKNSGLTTYFEGTAKAGMNLLRVMTIVAFNTFRDHFERRRYIGNPRSQGKIAWSDSDTDTDDMVEIDENSKQVKHAKENADETGNINGEESGGEDDGEEDSDDNNDAEGEGSEDEDTEKSTDAESDIAIFLRRTADF